MKEAVGLRKQFTLLTDKYWDLAVLGSSDLINDDLSTTTVEVSWKARSEIFKKALKEHQAAVDAATAAPTLQIPLTNGSTPMTTAPNSPMRKANAAPQTPQAADTTIPISALKSEAPTTLTSTRDMVPREAYMRLKKELDLKKEELKTVLRRIVEESDAMALKREKAATSLVSKIKKNFFAKRAKSGYNDDVPAVKRKTDIEVDDLKAMTQEIQMLELALETTEQKLETVSKEAKVMRQILQQPQGFAALSSLSSSYGSTTSYGSSNASPQKVDNRFTQITSGIAEAQASPASILHHLSLTTHRHLNEQVKFWKKMVLVRLCNSLITLPDPGALKQEVNSSSMAEERGGNGGGMIESSSNNSLVGSVPSSVISLHGEKEKRSRRKRIDVLINGEEYNVHNTSYDHNKHLYRRLRKLRAETIRIESFSDAPTKVSNVAAGVGGNQVKSRQAFITFRIAH